MAADSITLNRIKTLHPKIRQKALDDYNYINNSLLGKGVRLRFTATFRTPEEQHKLFLQHPKVTNADSWQSYHNYGLAFDMVILYDLNGDGSFETASWDQLKDFDRDGESDWNECIKYFKSKGWEWAGDWRGFKECPHFQIIYNTHWSDLHNKITSGDTITETIDNIKYTYPKL